jgi:hypothetical protein
VTGNRTRTISLRVGPRALLHGQGLARLARQVGPEIISFVLASFGTIAGLLSRLGAVRFVCGLPGTSHAESRFR